MITLVASYDGVMHFNSGVKPSEGMRYMWKSLHIDYLNVTTGNLRKGDIARAKQAFEVAAAYGYLTLQKVRGL